MSSIQAFVEMGKKRAFAGAVDWPGWCRSGRDETAALQALIDYGPRYAQVLRSGGIEFQFFLAAGTARERESQAAAGGHALSTGQAPTDAPDFIVTERHDGNATTDFGAPAITLDADREPIDRMEFERLQALLRACWQAFDSAVQRAAGRELRKGPRGGGRDLDKILGHVLQADRGYLARLAWKHKGESGQEPLEQLALTRQAILNALAAAVNGDLPEQGPRGGVIWPPRHFVRRVAWHALDHAWEIDDRILHA